MNARKLLLAGLCSAIVPSAFSFPNTVYYYDGASVTNLGTLNGDVSSYAYDINNAGQIVGSSANSAGVYRAFIYQNFDMQLINVAFNVTKWEARGINNNGEVVGQLRVSGDANTPRPWYWNIGLPQVAPLNSNPYSVYYPNYSWGTQAIAINDSGQIVGDSYVKWETVTMPFPDLGGDCYNHIPVRWSSSLANPAMVFCPADIGPNSMAVARDINNSGRIVGADRGKTDYGLFHSQSGSNIANSVPYPSNPSSNNAGYQYGEANGVNNNGAVAGFFSYGGTKRALYWNGAANTSVDLGVLSGGTHSVAREVNDQGFVIGYSEFKPGLYALQTRKAAFIWHPHFGMKKLPPASTPDNSFTDCEAFAVNNLQDSLIQAVGQCNINGNWRAVRWNIGVGKTVLVSPLGP